MKSKKFRPAALMLAAFMSLSSVSVMTSLAAQNSKAVLGDANGDGKVNIADATAIQRHIAGIKKLDMWAISRSRVCGKSTLSISDAAAVHRYAAGIIKKFPAEQTKPLENVKKVKNEITIYFSDRKGWDNVNAQVYNSSTGESMGDFPGTPMNYVETDEKGRKVFSLTVDVSKYDRVIFNNGTEQTTETPVTKASSGFYINSTKNYNGKYFSCVYPYANSSKGNINTVVMDYPEGYEKKVFIWTPEGYDPADKDKKYSVVYMLDGQNVLGNFRTLSGYEWACDETVRSLMDNGGDGIIVVGVSSNDRYRFSEMIPDFGKMVDEMTDDYEYDDPKNAKVLSDFIAKEVIPYVDKNYNTNYIRGIAGSSDGGICAFYIGMENMDKFRYIGAFSPSFGRYDKDQWDSYFCKMNLYGNVPKVYIYCGNNKHDYVEQLEYPASAAMEDWITAFGYSKDKVTTVIDEDATHSEGFWQLYFPEMLCYCLDI